jgi:hypothetical protein
MLHYLKLEFRINPLFPDSRKLKPFVDKCESLEAKNSFKQMIRGKKYKEQIQSMRDGIASNIQEFTVRNSILRQCVLIFFLSSMDPFQLRDWSKTWSKQVCMPFLLNHLNSYSS